MTKRVHVVDDDASFSGPRLIAVVKQAGYDESTDPSAQRLLDDLPSEADWAAYC